MLQIESYFNQIEAQKEHVHVFSTDWMPAMYTALCSLWGKLVSDSDISSVFILKELTSV